MPDITSLTVTTSAKFIPEVWSQEIISEAESRLVLADKVERYDDDVAEKGDLIHIPNVSNLDANDKVAQTAVTTQAPTEGENTITIDEHKETSFYVEDIVKVQSQYNLMAKYTKKAGYAIAKAIDSSLASLGSSFSQYVGDGSTNITDANIILANQYLDEADAPEESRFFVINSAGKADLMAIDKFVLRTGPGWSPDNSPILNGNKKPGFWGDIYGVKVFVSNNMVSEAGTPNIIHNMFFQKEAMGLALQQKPRVQSQYKLEYLSNLVVCDAIYGFAELRDTFAVDFRTKE